MRLTDKTAIITGSTRGIGQTIAEVLAAQGANIVISGPVGEPAEEVAGSINSNGGKAISVFCDITSERDVDNLVNQTIKAFGQIDILVNNAGITRDGLLIRMNEEDWDVVLNVNLKGMYRCCKAALRPMLKQRSGRIINIASIVGLIGNPGQCNYAAAKAGVIGFTKSLARETAQRGITVNAIAPGFIKTAMTDALNEEQKQKLLTTIPMGEIGLPTDVANAAAFLASDEARYITGHTLVVDGGLVMN
jgi:3-oxoacyl-[acyl-carrier protein] reductase